MKEPTGRAEHSARKPSPPRPATSEALQARLASEEAKVAFLTSQIYELRRLMQRVGEEGHLLASQAEADRQRLEGEVEALRATTRFLIDKGEVLNRCRNLWKFCFFRAA